MVSPPGTDSQQAIVDAMSARLVELAKVADEGAARAELRLWLEKIEAFASLRTEPLRVRPVIAQMLWTFGKTTEALGVALESLRRDGRDDLALDVIDKMRSAFLGSAFEALHSKRPDLARPQLQTVVDRLGGVRDVVEERATLALMGHVEAIAQARRGRTPVDGRPTLLKLGVWGERFIRSAERNVLACLLAPGNVPALGRFGPVILHIHTRAADADRIRAFDVVRQLSAHATIEITIIPEDLFFVSSSWSAGFWNRNILAMVEYDSLMRARQLGADMMCLGADMLMSDGCCAWAKQKLVDGYEAFLSSSLRAATEKMSPSMDPYREGPMLSVPAADLYRLSLDALHPTIFKQFVRQPPQTMGADPHQFFFTRPGGFAAHAFQWHPLAFSARDVPEDIGFDCNTIDCRFMSDLLAGKDRSKVCYIQAAPPEGLYFVGLDSQAGIETFGQFEVSPSGVARSAAHWIIRPEDFDQYIWALRQKAFYKVPPDLDLPLPADCPDEQSTVEAAVSGLEEMKPELMNRIGRFARQ